METLLDATGERDRFLAYPREGGWPSVQHARFPLNRTRAVLTEALGVPRGWRGAVEFDASSERDRLVALLVFQLLEGERDLYLLPSAGTVLLNFSHHDVVHVDCPTPAGIDAVVTAMAQARYNLPDAPPDATFKRPAWMQPPQQTSGDV